MQLLQLVHGRHDQGLRSGSTLVALDRLTAAGFVGRADAAQLAMAYRHLLLLGTDAKGNGSLVVDHIDLGPAKVNDTITSRVTEYLKATDRLLEALAPAALLSPSHASTTASRPSNGSSYGWKR